MLSHFLTIAFRILLKHRTFSLVSIGGLAIGISSSVFIFYFVYDEITYDQFHQHHERIYRINQTFQTPDAVQRIRFSHQKLGPYMAATYPQVEQFVRLEQITGRFGSSKITERGIFKADASVFDVFTLPLVKGNPHLALTNPKSIVVSETLAAKYSLKGEPGETVTIEKEQYTLTGIMRDMPNNTDLKINALISHHIEDQPSLMIKYDTYIVLRDGQDAPFIRQQLEGSIVEALHPGQPKEFAMGYEMNSLTDLHFLKGIDMDNPKGDKITVYAVSLVGAVLIIISVINFVNLSTIRSIERAKEVGIRKVTGAKKSSLIRQFLTESSLAIATSVTLALLLIQLLSVVFESVSGKRIYLSSDADMLIITSITGLLCVVVLASALYPAWILSSHQPVDTLYRRNTYSREGWLRKSFAMFQFALSGAVMMFLFVVLAQTSFIKQKPLGFSSEQIVVVTLPDDPTVTSQMGAIRNTLSNTPGVLKVSLGGYASSPGSSDMAAGPLWYKTNGEEKELIATSFTVDRDYPAMLNLSFVSGHDFSDRQNTAIVNEAFARMAGWSDSEAQTIRTYAGESQVVGVVKDFHFRSLHNSIEPMAIFYSPAIEQQAAYLFIKVENANTINHLEVAWNKVVQDHPLAYRFLHDAFNEQYSNEARLRTIFVFFTLITLMISGSGLLALALHHVQLKTKEIGIRKTFGASTEGIIVLLSQSFVKLTMFGSICGIVIGSYISNQWLSTFAYRISLSWTLIALTFCVLLIISSAIVCYRAYVGSKTNVAEVLKS